MRILILGGTSFVGRAVAQDALNAGHTITLFNRGRTGGALFPKASRVLGDRDTGDYSGLRGGFWDAVVDVSGYLPRHVGEAMDALGDRVGRYLYISTQAVFVLGVAGGDEKATRLAPLRGIEKLNWETYAPLKVACEDDVLARYGSRATIVRPGLVVGRHDVQQGFRYLVRRGSKGGRAALPGNPAQPVQVIDSRDLARLVVKLAESDREGAFNAVGPAHPAKLSDILTVSAELSGRIIEITPVTIRNSERFYPLITTEDQWTFHQRSRAKAQRIGLPSTSLEDTVRDVLQWDHEIGEPPLKLGISQAEEAALLQR